MHGVLRMNEPMLKDIPRRKVENIVLAIVPQLMDPESELWDVYIINLKQETISDVLISSRGYGERAGDPAKTSTLRHYFKEIPPAAYRQIEPIQRQLFDLHNEYFLSFKWDDYLFDKRYTFVAGAISQDNFTDIPLIGQKGVMIG